MDYIFFPFDFLERFYESSKNPFSKEKLKKGRDYAKNCHCIVGSLLRDSETSYKYGVKLIEDFSKIFKTVDIFILENGSKDNTRKIWKKYAKKCPENVKIFIDYPKKVDKYLKKKTIDHEITEDRIKKMAKLRNNLLENIKNKARKFDYDKYIFITDLDIKGELKKEGIYDTFSYFKKENVDAIGCNGLKLNCLYFDDFAYKKKMKSKYLFPSLKIPLNEGLFPVISTFSGGVFYKYDKIINLKYKFKKIKGEIICEHITLNQKIKKIFINTNMKYFVYSN